MSKEDIATYKLIIAIVCFALFLIFTFLNVSAIDTVSFLFKRAQLKKYKATEATIEECRIVQAVATRNKGKQKGSIGFYPRLIVSYEVNGRNYTADTKTGLFQGATLEQAYTFLQKLAPGQKITYDQCRLRYLTEQNKDFLETLPLPGTLKNKINIRYNPENPNDCDLTMRTNNPWIAVLVLLVISVPLLFLMRFSFLKIDKSLMILPVTVIIFLVTFILALLINKQARRWEAKDYKPYFSITVDESFNPAMLKQYMSSEDQEYSE